MASDKKSIKGYTKSGKPIVGGTPRNMKGTNSRAIVKAGQRKGKVKRSALELFEESYDPTAAGLNKQTKKILAGRLTDDTFFDTLLAKMGAYDDNAVGAFLSSPRLQNISEVISMRQRQLHAKALSEAVGQPKQRPTDLPTQSLSRKRKKTSTFNRGFKKSLMNDFTVTKNFDEYLTIPDPAMMKPGSLEYYAREKVLYPRFETQGRLRGMQIFENRLAEDIDFRSLDEVELGKLSQAYIKQEQRTLLKEHLADLKSRYGPGYRQYLRDLATSNIQALREEAYYNRGWQISTQDPFRKKPILPLDMSRDEAINYISKRVSADGGTLATKKNLPGFGNVVAQISDQGILTPEEISKIISGKNLLKLTPNATQVAEALDLEELMRLPYGAALGVANPVQGESYFSQQLNMKKQWMIESGAYPPMEPPKPAEKVFGQIRQGEIKLTDMSRSAKEQAVDVVKKAPVSAKTAARSMNAYVLAAAVAAGGLGLYGMNRQRGESQVGR